MSFDPAEYADSTDRRLRRIEQALANPTAPFDPDVYRSETDRLLQEIEDALGDQGAVFDVAKYATSTDRRLCEIMGRLAEVRTGMLAPLVSFTQPVPAGQAFASGFGYTAESYAASGWPSSGDTFAPPDGPLVYDASGLSARSPSNTPLWIGLVLDGPRSAPFGLEVRLAGASAAPSTAVQVNCWDSLASYSAGFAFRREAGAYHADESWVANGSESFPVDLPAGETAGAALRWVLLFDPAAQHVIVLTAVDGQPPAVVFDDARDGTPTQQLPSGFGLFEFVVPAGTDAEHSGLLRSVRYQPGATLAAVAAALGVTLPA